MDGVLTAPNLSQRNPVLYRLALVGWMAIALLCVGLFWVDLVTDYFEIIVPCTEGVPGVFNDCNGAALTPAEVSVWTSWGLSLESYGVFTLSGATFTFLVYTVLAGLLLWQQRQSWLGLMISLALIVIPFAMFAGSRDFGAIHPNLGWPAVVAYIVGNGIMLLFLYLVPNGRFSPRWAYIPLLATFLLLFGPLEVPLVSAATVGLVLFGGSLQLYRYLHEANAVERQQTKWIIFGVVIFVTAIIAWVLVFGRALPIPDGQPRMIAILISGIYQDFFAIPFLPIAITIAILRYRLWGIDVLIRRMLVYLLLSGLLALVYFGTVILLQSVFGAFMDAQSPVVIVLSTLLIAALFTPLRRRVQTFIDRRFYRQKYDAQQVLARFAQTARDEVAVDALQAELVGVVQETMQPAQISIWLREQ
ncbi:MAG: hypothetical protein R3D55_17895 [Chloroflexota bacterium]